MKYKKLEKQIIDLASSLGVSQIVYMGLKNNGELKESVELLGLNLNASNAEKDAMKKQVIEHVNANFKLCLEEEFNCGATLSFAVERNSISFSFWKNGIID